MQASIAISASGGAMRSLPRKLNSLLSEPEYGLQQAEKDEIVDLKHDLEKLISSYLLEPSEVQGPALTAERWVKEVRELSYDIDDFVDELVHDGANARISFARKTSRVKIARLQKKPNPRGWITAEIKGFKIRVKDVIQRHIRYRLDKLTMRPKGDVSDEGQLPLLHGVEAVHGLMKELESRLLTDDGDGEQHKLKVVSITGFGGVGKTTLASQLYSHLRGRFECGAFVRTSRKPDMRRLLTNMLSQLRRHQPMDAWEVPDLIKNIREHLQDKKYFIIIDDLWTLSTWNIVSCALPDSNRCSRVLITTEVDIVAQACCGYKSNNIVTMKPLSDNESTELFLSIAFGHEHECSGQLDEVSCAIIRKCGGLPLAIITIASLLASQRDSNMEQYCNYIQNSMSFNLGTNPTLEGMKQVLNLSYNNLPQRLKACMLYLSMYQEDYIISKDDLVKQWIAEGFISVEGKDMEEVAERYFNELINKGMIQPVDINYNGDVLSCTVHYMVLNLIRYKSIEENFITTIDHSQTAIRLVDKVRRLSLHFGNEKDATPPANMRLSQVRSLAFSGFFKCMRSITEFKLLRVLILKLWVDHDDTSHNLNEISKLFRLRYLYIDACHLSLELPTEMQLLKDLVTLKIDAKVSEVPLDIVHLHALFHLHLPGETNLPDSIGHMTSLRTLAYYNLSSNSEDNVLNLGKLTNLRDLCLTCSTVLPNNLESNMQHLGSILGKLGNLKSLTLNTLDDDVGVTSMSISCEGLSSMSVPPAVLERLEFSRRVCTFSRLPSWVGKLNKLCILKIAVRELLRNDIDILKGLPALTALSLYALVSPSRRIVFDGAGFRILKYFKFVCTAPCLAFIKGAMPNVTRLKLGFNANRMEQYNPKRAGFEHLTGLKEISAKIGGACAGAESVLITAVSKHASNPRINVQLVDWKFYDDEDRSMSRREQEHLTPEEQDEILEKHSYQYFGTQDEDPREVEKKQADSRERESDQSSMEMTTGAMNPLLLKLGELLKDEYKLEKRVRKGVMSLETELTMVHVVLRKVAEVPPDQLDEQVRIWARKVRELSYDMEDAVDAFMVRVEEGRDCEPAGANLKNRVKKFLKKITRLFTVGRALHQIAAAMEEAKDLAKQLAHLRQRYGLNMHNTSAGATIDPRLMAMFKDVEDLVGTDSTRDELIKMLTEGDDASKQRLRTVSIYGFGGLGKTTLANFVYQKLKVKAQFDCWAFVSVSQNPDAKKFFKDMLYQFNNQKYENIHNARMDETQLIREIREFLKSKRYLVVIDDIWDVEAWEAIKCALIENDHANRVITTTRLSNVAQKVGGAYELKPLCPASSKILFYGRIFGGEDKCPDQLAGLSEKILKKCGGVPLAIITVASLLASKKEDAREWKIVLDSIGAGLENSRDVKNMRKILALSYYHLPCHLKACLLYLSVFPEDYEIGSARLIWRWIAEGFVQPGKQGTSLFEIGESYLNELVNRSMVQPLYMDDFYGRKPACRVHDMVLDLICALSSEENFVTILDGTKQSMPNSQSKVRRLSIQNSNVDETTSLVSVSQVRSITIFRHAINLKSPLSSIDVLRVLDLEGCDLGESSPINLRHIGNLFHLRYLGLANTNIRELPAEIGKLQFLQVLDVRDNMYLKQWPSTVVKLQRLMCLFGNQHYESLPDGIGNLTSLEELHWICTEGRPNIVKELHNLVRLRVLRIAVGRFKGSKELEEAFVESLCNMPDIQSLVIYGCFPFIDLLGERWVPPRNLHRFRMEVSTGIYVDSTFSTLPAWVKRDPSLLSHLSELLIHVKELWQEDLQILGRLPALRFLEIKITDPTQMLLSGADGFQSLMCFNLRCWHPGHLMFQQGALPMAQKVEFPFNAWMAKDGNVDFDSGLRNLLSLRHVVVTILGEGAEAEEAEAALRHEVHAHPNHPTIRVDLPFVSESDDDDTDVSSGEESPKSDDDGMDDVSAGEESPASDGDDDEDGPEKSS